MPELPPVEYFQAFQGFYDSRRLRLQDRSGRPQRIAFPPAVDRDTAIQSFFQPLSNLTYLGLKMVIDPRPEVCAALTNTLLSSLRYLRLEVGRADPAMAGDSRDAAEALAPFLTRLKGLHLALRTQEDWAAFTPKLAECVDLEELVLCGPKFRSAVVENFSTGTFLSKLIGLTRLLLDTALDPRTAATDIACLSHLSALHYLGMLSWRASPDPRLSDQQRRDEVAKLLRDINLLPLAGLRMLRQCHIANMRRTRGSETSHDAFKKRLHDLQWSTGLPLAEVADPEYAFSRVSPESWLPILCNEYLLYQL